MFGGAKLYVYMTNPGTKNQRDSNLMVKQNQIPRHHHQPWTKRT